MVGGLPRILIVRLSSIGDVVRTLPALHVLRDAFPEAQIDWAVEAKSAGIVEGHPVLDTLHVYDRPARRLKAVRSFMAFCRTIRRSNYDIVLDFHGILKSGLIAAASGAKERYGFARPRSQEGSWLFTNRKVRLPSDTLNRIEENLVLCEPLAARRKWPNVTVYVPCEVQEEVERYFEETFHGGKWIVAMHAPVDRPDKQWPLEHFAALADALLGDGRFEVLLTWGPGQFQIAEEVALKSRRNPIIAPETADLKHYAWLVHRSDLYFGGDTGPMHIASVMGTPVVAVFGGTDPAKHAPYRQPYEVLAAGEASGSGKLSATERLAAITPEMAYDACVRIVARSRAGQPVNRST